MYRYFSDVESIQELRSSQIIQKEMLQHLEIIRLSGDLETFSLPVVAYSPDCDMRNCFDDTV